ncbi:hypothetical protein LTS18_001013, partial [Coniosporium uncinatum]
LSCLCIHDNVNANEAPLTAALAPTTAPASEMPLLRDPSCPCLGPIVSVPKHAAQMAASAPAPAPPRVDDATARKITSDPIVRAILKGEAGNHPMLRFITESAPKFDAIVAANEQQLEALKEMVAAQKEQVAALKETGRRVEQVAHTVDSVEGHVRDLPAVVAMGVHDYSVAPLKPIKARL